MTQFAVLQFSPEPEFTEYVNVALLLLDGKASLHYDKQFPKLRCISPSFHTELLESWLHDLEHELLAVPSRDAARLAVETRTSQMRFGEFSYLSGHPSSDTIQRLLSLYLRPIKRPSTERATMRADEHVPRVETLLDKFLRTELRVLPHALRKASPKRFLSPEVREHIANGFTVSRVVNGSRALVLLDAVDLSQSAQRVAKRSQDVRYGFFVMRGARDIIRRYEHRDVVTASVIFNSAEAARDPHLDFTVHELRRESDIAVEADRPSGVEEKKLRQALLEAGAEPGLLS